MALRKNLNTLFKWKEIITYLDKVKLKGNTALLNKEEPVGQQKAIHCNSLNFMSLYHANVKPTENYDKWRRQKEEEL